MRQARDEEDPQNPQSYDINIVSIMLMGRKSMKETITECLGEHPRERKVKTPQLAFVHHAAWMVDVL